MNFECVANFLLSTKLLVRDMSYFVEPALMISLGMSLFYLSPIFYMLYKYQTYTVKFAEEYVPLEENEHYIIQWLKQLIREHQQSTAYSKFKLKLFIMSLFKPFRINDASRIIEQVIERPEDLRAKFNNMQDLFRTFPMRHADAHTHPASAVNRSAMASFMADLALKWGFEPYHISCSKSDSYDGCRYFYNHKDLTIPYKESKINNNSVLIMTDVDYYADMNKWLSLMRPMLLYTLVPTKLANRTSEYSYHFEGDELVYNVKGGATYRHKLWVYDGDTLSVEYNRDVYTYHIDQRIVPNDPDHRFICLIPASKVSYPQALLLPPAENQNLRRFRNTNYLYDPITDNLSLKTSSKYHPANINGLVYNAIKERLVHKTSPPIIADVETILTAAKIEKPSLLAPLIFNNLDLNIERNVICTTNMANYTPIVEGAPVNQDPRPSGENGSTNLVVPGAAFPSNGIASDIASINGRVIEPKNDKTPPASYKSHAHDFLTQLIRYSRVGSPWTVHQVEQEQDKPLQRARTAAIKHTVSMESPNKLSAFVKVEPYARPNDPRNITSMSPELTLMMSRFTYAFKESILKPCPFYHPTMTPEQICNRLKELTTDDGVLLTDYSRFDGSISQWLQTYIVRAAYMRWLTMDQCGEFDKCFRKVFIDRARTRNGHSYDPGWGTRSGSPITTDGNTMINAFVMYVALRKTGLTVCEAYNALGLYCGDDGYTTNRPNLKFHLETVVRELGLGVEVTVQRQGPYPYCGRLFINPAVIPDSFQDLKRTLPKLHLIKNGTESKEQRLTNKAIGYKVTDNLTPILGDWANKVLSLTGLGPKNITNEELYKMNHPWPQTDTEAIRAGVMKQLDMDSIEIQQMQDCINAAESLTDFPVLFEWTPETKITCIRGDIIEHPREQHNINDITTTNDNNVSEQEETTNGRPARNTTAAQATGSNEATREHQQQQRVDNVIPPLARGSRRSNSKYNVRTSKSPPKIYRQNECNGVTSSNYRQRANNSGRKSPSGSNKGNSTIPKRVK